MIHEVDQNSHAWEDLRAGKLTASEAGEWLLAEPKLRLNGGEIKSELDRLGIKYVKTSKVGDLADLLPADIIANNQGYLKKDTEARESAMCKMIGRELSPVTNDWMGNRFTDFGHEFEDMAATEFELRTGYTCKKVGFVTLDGFQYFGASPDRYIYDSDGSFIGPLEIKCKPEAHVKIVIGDVLPDEHKLQVHYQILLSGSQVGYFFAYSPDMQPFTIKIHADEYTDKLEKSLIKFDAEYQQFRNSHLNKLTN